MARIEKTIFISYRRADVFNALAVYENLKNQGYDVFFDYTSIHSGDFEQIIISNIKARAHFLLILTPTALDRCNNPGDWLRREIEIAIDEKRNIVPLFFEGFRFGSTSVKEKLTGKLRSLSRYNGLNVHEDYFQEAMDRLCELFLNIPLNTVLHPISNEVQKVVKEEQVAADKALNINKELEQLKSQAIQYELRGDFWNALETYYKIKKIDPVFPRVNVKIQELEEELKPKPVAGNEERAPTNSASQRSFQWRSMAGLAGIVSLLLLFIWGGSSIFENLASNTPQITQVSQSTAMSTFESTPTNVGAISTSVIHISPTAIPNVGFPTVGNDGMALIFIPAGDFSMGSTGNQPDERPVHTVFLDDYLIDQTEVTNAMYILCVDAGRCDPPRDNTSIEQNASNHSFYYGNPEFDDFPVIFVSWNDAKAYCSWIGRRLPTEAEWEKAASWNDNSQTKRLYPWGNDIDCTYANYWGNGDKLCIGDTTPVGNYPKGASFYGVLDMAGNVSEWVADRYDPEYYGDLNNSNPKGPRSGDNIVVRGGSFLIGRANGIRSSDRDFQQPDYTSYSIGFRCAMDAP